MADKYISLVSGQFQEVEALDSSAGVGSAGDIPALDSTGRLALNMMPVGVVPDVQSIVTSENLAAGDLVNVYNVTGTPTARKADNTNGRRAHGFVLAGVTSPAAANVYFDSTITGLSALTPGANVFLGAAGAVTETPPSTTGYLSQEIGIAISATEVVFEAQMPITLA